MSKKQDNHDLIMSALKESGRKYRTLNQKEGMAIHVRIYEFGDVWPTSGTMKKGDTWIKKDPEAVVAALLGVNLETGEISKASKITLEERIEALELRVKRLEEKMQP